MLELAAIGLSILIGFIKSEQMKEFTDLYMSVSESFMLGGSLKKLDSVKEIEKLEKFLRDKRILCLVFDKDMQILKFRSNNYDILLSIAKKLRIVSYIHISTAQRRELDDSIRLLTLHQETFKERT